MIIPEILIKRNYFVSNVPFWSLWKQQKTFGFLMFSGGSKQNIRKKRVKDSRHFIMDPIWLVFTKENGPLSQQWLTHTSVAYETLQYPDGNMTDLKDCNVTFFPLVFHSRFDSSIHLLGVCDAILPVGKAVKPAVWILQIWSSGLRNHLSFDITCLFISDY